MSFNQIPQYKKNPNPNGKAFHSERKDYKECSNCALPVGPMDSEEIHCLFCKQADPAEFKSRTKITSTSCLG